MGDYTPIHCDLHDHIEVACLYRYRVRLSTRDDRIIVGDALTTETDKQKREWLLIETGQGDTRVRLDEIRSMEALTAGAKFEKVNFSS